MEHRDFDRWFSYAPPPAMRIHADRGYRSMTKNRLNRWHVALAAATCGCDNERVADSESDIH